MKKSDAQIFPQINQRNTIQKNVTSYNVTDWPMIDKERIRLEEK